EWFALGFLSPPTGLGAAFGVSKRTRHGIAANSWDDTSALSDSDELGRVPYTINTVSFYPGLVESVRAKLSGVGA
ncbi:MAG TPA: hypothetical protein VGJ16_14285, partial [Pirellulales bacterium]